MSKNYPLLMEIGQGLSIALGLPSLDSWTTKDRPKDAIRGTFGFNTDTNAIEYCDGEDWYSTPVSKI